MRRLLLSGIILGLATSGCRDGSRDSGADDGGSDESGGDTGGGPAPLGCEDDLGLGPAPLRRLTRNEYDNTIRDLLGDDSRLAQAFVADDTALGFAVAGHVSPLVVQQYMDAAEAIAARTTEDLPSVGRFIEPG